MRFVSFIRKPLVIAMLGAATVALGRTDDAMPTRRQTLMGRKPIGKLAGEVRNVAGEVRAAREKAEQIGKILR